MGRVSGPVGQERIKMRMRKPFGGTWFEFQHHSPVEGTYWNRAMRAFTREQWQEKVREIASLGMEYLVLMCTSLPRMDGAESYYHTSLYPFAEGFACFDPMEALLSAADEQGMKVFISCGFYGQWDRTQENISSKKVERRAFQSMEELLRLYGGHTSFYGWYYPDETEILPYFDEDFLRYVNRYSAFADSLDPFKKKLIAPYGTNRLTADGRFTRQLESLCVDYVAYQDEVGVRKASPSDTRRAFEALRKAHDQAGRSALWCDLEIFDFEGETYRSPLIPADADRVRRQLESVQDYADVILMYQYQGMMNRPGTGAYCGHSQSTEYYLSLRFLSKRMNRGERN